MSRVVKEGGFFVECGGLDGERLSNTAFLERQRNWQGLLVEMDPYFYTQLLGKNRRVWSVNCCLSPYNYFTTVRRYTVSQKNVLLLQLAPTSFIITLKRENTKSTIDLYV